MDDGAFPLSPREPTTSSSEEERMNELARPVGRVDIEAEERERARHCLPMNHAFCSSTKRARGRLLLPRRQSLGRRASLAAHTHVTFLRCVVSDSF